MNAPDESKLVQCSDVLELMVTLAKFTTVAKVQLYNIVTIPKVVILVLYLMIDFSFYFNGILKWPLTAQFPTSPCMSAASSSDIHTNQHA